MSDWNKNHQGRPTEAWMRDMVFDDPWPLIQAFCNISHHTMPDGDVYRYRELQTAVGPCDLALIWPNNILVVEMKRDEADEGAVTQCLRYIGALDAQYRSAVVTGLICAPSISRNALYAISVLGYPEIRYCKFSMNYGANGVNARDAIPQSSPDPCILEILDPQYPEDEEAEEDSSEDDAQSPDIVEQAREIVAAAESSVSATGEEAPW